MDRTHKGKVIDRKNGYDIIDCAECGFIHIEPIPSGESMEAIYKDTYYEEEKPRFIERQTEDIEWWNVIYDDRLDFMEKTLASDRRRILDIGCGPGFFLKRAAGRGWRGVGIEPSSKAAKHAEGLGLDVRNAILERAGIEKERFDAIHMSEVLEHIPDPAGMIERTFNLLNDGGIICVIVPNDYNPLQAALRDKPGCEPYWISPPHHINYFTFDSMEGLLKKKGFDIIERTAMFPMEFFLLSGDNYVGNDTLGRACHGKRKRLDVMLNEPPLREFRKAMYLLMAGHKIGREMALYAKKP